VTFVKIIVFFIGAAGMSLAQTTFTLDRAVYAPGQDIVSSWTGGPGSATDWVGIYPRGTVPDGDPGSTLWLYVNGSQTATSGLVDGSLTFASPGLPAGEWSAHFLANNGYTPITTEVDFEVADVTIIQSFGPDHQFIDEGLPITLNWSVTGVDPPVTSLTLDDGSGPINVLGQFSIEVSPVSNREYVLELNNAQRAVAKIFKDAGNTVAFSLNEIELESGDPLTVAWVGATANPDSWVGVYRAGDTPDTGSSTAWNYLNGSQTAGGNVPDGEMSFNLADGFYYACLFLDNGHIIEQGPIRFTVGDGSPATGDALTEWHMNGTLDAISGDSVLTFAGNSEALVSWESSDNSLVPHMSGGPVSYLRVPAFGAPTEGIDLSFLSVGPNGGGQYLNQFTFVFDVLVPSPLSWTPFFNTNPGNANDADFFVSSSAALGIGDLGYAPDGAFTADAWQRVIFTADLEAGIVKYFVDGALVHQHSGAGLLDGRFSLYTVQDSAPHVKLFGDDSGDTHEILVSAIAFLDQIIDETTASELGAAHSGGIYFKSSGLDPLGLAVGSAPGGGLELSWKSASGKLYDILVSPDLSSPRESWAGLADAQDIESDPSGRNTLVIDPPFQGEGFVAVREKNPPPLFFDDLESGAVGWTTLVNDGLGNTRWELGSPNGSTGPLTGAEGSANAWCTNLGDYGPDSNISLRSPAIDLTGVSEAELSFAVFRDADGFGDTAVVRFLRAGDLVALGQDFILDMSVFDSDYESIEVSVPEAAIGESTIIEFRFSSDSSADVFSGFSLDNIKVQIP